MFAPMSLTSYEDARPWLRSIKRRVTERTMPLWGSEMPHGVFRNDPRLIGFWGSVVEAPKASQ
jgi:hypothetical protein